MTEEKRQQMIAALLREREGCDRHRRSDRNKRRVSAIDAELERLGYTVEKAAAKREVRPRKRAEKRG